MRIDPQLRALRSDTAPQRKAQIALEAARDAWAQGPARKVLEELERYGSEGALGEYPALAGLFAQEGTARELTEALMASLLEEVRAHPLGQVPLRHQYKDGLSVLQIAQRGRAALSLITYEETQIDPTSVCFAGGERHEAVLAGSADICEFELLAEGPERASIDCHTRRAVAGEYLRCEGQAHTRQIRQVHGRFVVLRLSRTEEVPPETRQYSLADGRLLHRASGCRAESQREMATALLGRMGRSDVAPLLARLTREGSDHIRWQTLRECLALDTVQGFVALSAIARDPADPLSTPAGALMAQLVEAHPQLSQIEVSRCPA
ncbi:hypothetical protein K3165_04410 [Qipengyuania sp. 1XM1-15A]|uniref:hypothetical protein n=1 Tax=Qipengyuania xiamenensis TaxID=2867237 RepID=UPI001C872EB4|nr:hypothetical protein [Qipengyuania xiamenensis]MBX7532163.1 hypothetical protein [Qipengyuania xiamenensis]